MDVYAERLPGLKAFPNLRYAFPNLRRTFVGVASRSLSQADGYLSKPNPPKLLLSVHVIHKFMTISSAGLKLYTNLS